ncbi:PDZ domain-containing protein [Patescibacteria group bacterium]|nr:PDZ domain-containing protein [Patescibacteria group bacterium]
MVNEITPASVRAKVDRSEGTTPKRGRYLGITLALLFAIGTFMTGLRLGELGILSAAGNNEANSFSLFASTPGVSQSGVNLDEFWRVWEILDNKFTTSGTTTVSTEEKIQGAIDGLVDAYGDPYTVFLPPADTQALTEDISGNFSGVGMEVGIRDEVITVIAPLPETPAERAGIVAGDVIVKIDGVTTESMRVDEAVRLIRGEKGTSVTFEIFRKGETEFRTIEVVRDNINVPTVVTERKDDTFVIKLYSFNAISEAKMQDALREYVRSDATTMVLDLRGNPGGLLQSAVAIAGFFLPTGKIVVRENYGDDEEETVFRSQGRTLRDFAPKQLVVLVDGGSASASEILAGALQDHGVATVIGSATFGKGSVQELVDLPSGASVKVTVARWLTPDGVSISQGGLTPDIKINRTPQQFIDGQDPQLDAALRFLKGEEVVSEVASSTPVSQ